ncbi:RICIN domain-containing protein [Granulicella sp. S156]|jgi:chitinase|uniref:RICIN domain-containing protein n=1 Tax=Granulicella sp. S156 TaxID=1747224 RepID=UPI00131DFAD8|nr:glycosyl hydrolase family 18 protein [Granulicella sp. S156]
MKNRFLHAAIVSFVFCLFVLLTPLTLLHAQNTLVTGTPYNIVNENSGSCVDDTASGTANGTSVQQWACGQGTSSTQPNQQWEFENGTASGYYYVANVNAPTETWNVTGNGTTNGSLIQTWTYSGNSNEEWEAVSLGNGYYKFVGQGSGLCLDTPSASTANGVQLDIYTCNGTAAQAFKLVTPTSSGGGTTTGSPLLVGYIPDYNGSFAGYATSINFSKMTHLNLAFAVPPTCNGTCTASSDMTFSLNQTDADIATLVNAAHAAGVKVLLSIGGGGGDQQIIQFYNAGLSTQLVASLANYISAHNLDGVDLDIEDPNNMGTPYATFTSALVAQFRPQGKAITAAVAEYLQSAMPDSALHQFDFVNVMVYSNLSDCQTALQYYSATKSVPNNQIVLGVPFFGQSSDGNTEEEYNTILAAYPDAWQSDEVSGGSLDGGIALYYVGEATMAQETQLGAQYGGIMIWELTGDAPAPHSLLTVVQNNL